MSSLRQLLASHHSVLLLDAASSRVQVGLLERDRLPRWEESDAEAGVGVFGCIDALGLDLAEVGTFVFCHGPGSILGIRTVAMALRSWNVLKSRPVYAYSSLALVAESLERADLGIIADARRDSWHFLRRGEPLRRLSSATLTGDLAMPEHFRHWSALPPGTVRVPYSVAAFCEAHPDADLFHTNPAPDAFLHEEPSYVTWTPQIHRAPTTS